MTELSPTTKALLRAARNDGPSASARAQLLNRIASGTGAPAGVGATAAKATLAAGGSAKLLAFGALLGSAVTVGVAAVLLHIGTPKLGPDPVDEVHADSEISAIAPAARGTAFDDSTLAAPLARPATRVLHETTHAPAPGRRAGPRDLGEIDPALDPLEREAALVAEARSAIVRGEPDVALGALRATTTLPTRAMEPEELSLQARALRAAGREPEAAFVDAQLKALFPDNALSR